MNQIRKYIAEFMGTGTLVLFGCGVAVLTNGDIMLTSIAFGMSIIVGAYAISSISGCHVNPAVSLAMLINGKLSIKDFDPWIDVTDLEEGTHSVKVHVKDVEGVVVDKITKISIMLTEK